MIDESRLSHLLAPFDVKPTARQTAQILAYLDALTRWNRKMNLTAIRGEEECVTRHFGESLLLASRLRLTGRLLDIGSGAGFPGLALKIAFPALAITLLEPVAKKRAFLKEVARALEMSSVEVRGERIEEFAGSSPSPVFETVTSRAVGQLDRLVPAAAKCLTHAGRLCLWVTNAQTGGILDEASDLVWESPIPIPLSQERQILIGTLTG